MKSRGKKWNGSRMLSAFLACIMIVSSISLPARAAESSAEVAQLQEDTSEHTQEAGTGTPEQSENPESEDGNGQPVKPGEEAGDGEQTGNPGLEDGNGQPAKPGEEAGDEEQTGNPGSEDGNGQPAKPGEEAGDEEQTENPGTEDGNGQPAKPGEEDAVKKTVSLSGIMIPDKVYDGKEAAYTGTAVLKDADNKVIADTEVSLLASYAGTLADGSTYEETESAPSQAGTYTLTFSLAGEGADQYTLEEAVYSFEITRKEIWIYAGDVQAVIGRELPAVTELTYHIGANGLVEEDKLLTPPSLRYSQENIPTDVAGEYEIIPYGADAGNNYSIKYANGKLTVGEEKILYSGTTNDISWKIDQGGKLTIEGTGDYECTYKKSFQDEDGFLEDCELPPWCEYGDTWKVKVNSAEVKVTGITKTAKMFAGCGNLKTVDLSGLDMSSVTDMTQMFYRCTGFKSFDLSALNTSNVINMSGLFENCSSLENLNLSGLDTSNVTNMQEMFFRCKSLKSLDLSGLDTSNVINMSSMLEDCSSLENLNLNGLDTSNVYSMSYMFGGCSNLHSLDLRGLDTSSAVVMTGMFRRCVSLESLDLGGWDMSNVTSIRSGSYEIYDTGFLDGCDNLTWIRTPRISYRTHGWVLYLPRPAGGGRWYDDRGVAYKALDHLDGSIILTRKNLNAGKINDILWEIDENGRLTISGTGAYYDGRQMVDANGKIVEELPPWTNRSDVLTAVVHVSEIPSTSKMFYGCTKLNSIDLIGLDTSEVTDMSAMFEDCSSLETLNLTDMDTSGVTNMSAMFQDCSNLESLNLTGLDTSGVTNMSAMFQGCSSLRSLNLTGLDTSGVIDMSAMFQSCSGLKNLNLDSLDTGNVGSMDSMFRDCTGLEILNLNGLDTGHVESMGAMFQGCSNLRKLDLSSFDTSCLGSIQGMFRGCSRLESVDLSSFDLSNVTYTDEIYFCNYLFDSIDDSLSFIKTPRNCGGLETLPAGGKWYDRNGKEYTQLPCGLAESIELYRSGESESGQEQYAYVSGITVASKIYDGNAFAYTGTAGVTDATGKPISGIVLTASYEGTLADGSEYPITDQAPSQAGTYTLSFAMTGTDGDSYILRNAAYSFRISRRQVTVTAPDRTVAVGGQLPELSAVDDYTVDGILTGDQLLKAPAFKYGKANIVTTKPGSYAIIPYGAEAGANYCIRYVKGQLTVGEKNSYDLAEAEILFSDIEYDGKGHVVNPVVKYRDWTLRVGIDYKLWVENATGSMQGPGWKYDTVCNMGKYTIHITGMGFYYGEQTKTFRVVFSKDMDFGDILPDDIPDNGQIPGGFWVACDSDDYTYTGKAIKPAVRVYNHTTLLKEKTDYTISYANNVKANVTPGGDWLENVSATPTVTVKGKGNYSGSWTEYFNIRQDDISCAGSWYTPKVTVAYTGKPQKPQPVFMTEWDRNAKLKSSNYTVQYYRGNDADRTEPLSAVQEEGEYVIRCTGKGNYAGVAECPLTVTKLKVVGKLKVSKIPNQPYTGSEICPAITVKDGKTTLTAGEHYNIMYYNYNTEVGTGEVWIEGIPEGGYAGERQITFKITGTPIKKAAVSGLTAAVYSGTQHKPEPVLTMKKTVNGTQTTETLQKDRDYEISWQKNENAGSATVVITGIGGYTGSVKKTFKIGKYDITANAGEKFMAALAEQSFSYEKGGVKAKPVVTFRVDDSNQLTLTEGKDYTLSYRQHTDLTKDGKRAEITVKGKGNFSGTYSTKLTYEIVRQDIGRLTLTAQDKVYQNKKNIYATKVTVTDVNGKTLKAGADYDKAFTYTYENPTEVQDTAAGKAVRRAAGDAVVKTDIIPVGTVLRVKVAAKEGGNYYGTLEGTYRIAQASIASVKVSIPKQAYTGQPVTLNKEEITVKSKSGETLADDQWEIVEDSYKNNVKKGTASVTIRGLNQYGGTKTVKFTIKAQSIEE